MKTDKFTKAGKRDGRDKDAAAGDADSVLRREDLMQCYRYISKKIGRELGALAPESGAREDLYTVMKRFAGFISAEDLILVYQI